MFEYYNSMNYIFFLPISFGGNPSSESGPRAVYNEIKNMDEFKDCALFLIEPKFDESPKTYMVKVNKLLNRILDKCDSKCCVIGGNHLSILPVYQYIVDKNNTANILVLDAHRDYYPQTELNHATFLSFVKKIYNKIVLVGCRDNGNHSCVLDKCKVIYRSKYNSINQLSLDNIDLLDIDLDVIDEKEFSSYSDYLENGLSIKDVKDLICFSKEQGNCILSISEYVPLFDNGLNDLFKIIEMVNLFFQ